MNNWIFGALCAVGGAGAALVGKKLYDDHSSKNNQFNQFQQWQAQQQQMQMAQAAQFAQMMQNPQFAQAFQGFAQGYTQQNQNAQPNNGQKAG